MEMDLSVLRLLPTLMNGGGIHALILALSLEELMFIFLEIKLGHVTIILEFLVRDFV